MWERDERGLEASLDDTPSEKPKNDDIYYLTALDKDFPEKLLDIPNPPRGIYFRGALPDPCLPTVAMIGSRSASPYGIAMANRFAEELSDAGVQIVSGMARGIDGVSQRAAERRGHPTFGVLGSGVDIVYPMENRDIYEGILVKGGLISEFPPGTPPRRENFPSRNRIISGLAELLLVVEARQHSGTSITVRAALEQGKDVYAVPGRLTDPFSAGCNQLIADGAGVAINPEIILEALGILKSGSKGERKLGSRYLAKREKKVYSVLDFYPKSLDELSKEAEITIPELLELLLKLELKGVASEIGKNYYNKKL